MRDPQLNVVVWTSHLAEGHVDAIYRIGRLFFLLLGSTHCELSDHNYIIVYCAAFLELRGFYFSAI